MPYDADAFSGLSVPAVIDVVATDLEDPHFAGCSRPWLLQPLSMWSCAHMLSGCNFVQVYSVICAHLCYQKHGAPLAVQA